MNIKDIKPEIITLLDELNLGQQAQVLNYIKDILGENLPGSPVDELLKFAGSIPKEDWDTSMLRPNKAELVE